MADKQDPQTKAENIEALLRIVDASKGEVAEGERLNHQERRFFRKHPDRIHDVLDGGRPHVRVNSIVRKMSTYGLGIDDIDLIWQVLNQRGRTRP